MAIRDKSEYEKKGVETSTYPSQYDNADYGKKRKAKTKTIPMKNTTTGQVYGYKTIEEGGDTVYPNAIVIHTKRGRAVGEIYQDQNGWGCFHYRLDTGADGMDNRDQALEELQDMHSNYLQNRGVAKDPEYRPVAESFIGFLVTEAEDTRLPNGVVGEIRSLINKGAKDLAQAWKNVFELVHTAYHVANVKRPTPDKKGAWKQYEDLLKVGVKALADTRGLSGKWRSSATAFAEGLRDTPELDALLTEASGSGRKHRIFVKVRNIGHDDGEQEHEVDAMSVDEVIHSFMHQAKRNGRHIRIEPDHKNGVTKLVVYVKGASKNRDEQLISVKDWSI